MNFLKQIVWPAIKPILSNWLTSRALVLPANKASDIAKKFGVPVEVVLAIDSEILAQVPVLLEQFRP